MNKINGGFVLPKEKALLKSILAPVDGSDASHYAEETAATIASRTRASVTVLHVIPYSIIYAKLSAGFQIPQTVKDNILAYVEESAERIVADASAFFAKKGVNVDTKRIRFADVANSILRVSRKPYDMIVMGSRGENEKDPYALGSVTKTVRRHSTCPVLIAKTTTTMSNMLVGIDGSRNSTSALRFAARLGHVMNSKITLLNVQDRRLHEVSPETARQCGEFVITKAIGRLEDKSIIADRKVEFGVPQDVIVETAEQGRHDLIVVSRIGEGIVNRFLLGSVSDDVTHKARCSVLVTPPAKP
jgi:nucleotide-binding universal stress UspA family protein